jgi:hypothetical protein
VTPDADTARNARARASQSGTPLFEWIFDTLAHGADRDKERYNDGLESSRPIGETPEEARCRDLEEMRSDTSEALADLEDQLDQASLEVNRRRLRESIATLNAKLKELNAKIAACESDGAPGADPGTGTPGGGTPPPFAFTTPRPTTVAGDMFEGTQWNTLTTGGTTDVATEVEIEVQEPYTITGFYAKAKTGTKCKVIGSDNVVYELDANNNWSMPAGVRAKAIRCEGKDTKEIVFRLLLSPQPASGMKLTVKATKTGALQDVEVTTFP